MKKTRFLILILSLLVQMVPAFEYADGGSQKEDTTKFSNVRLSIDIGKTGFLANVGDNYSALIKDDLQNAIKSGVSYSFEGNWFSTKNAGIGVLFQHNVFNFNKKYQNYAATQINNEDINFVYEEFINYLSLQAIGRIILSEQRNRPVKPVFI